MSKVVEFKEVHKRFTDALKYIVNKEAELKKDPARWEKVKKNFFTKFEAPLDKAWLALTEEEQKRLAPLYLHRKAQQDEVVKKVIKTFKAKITKVEKIE